MNTEPDTKQGDDQGPRCGQRLAAAREEMQISIVEIAKELHLDEQKVQALENNEFAPLGAPVFAKGHLKKYAQLVKVNIDDILVDYHKLTRSDGLPPVVSNRKAPKIAASPTPWILAVVVVLIIAAAIALWYFVLRDSSAVPGAEPEAVTQPALPVESEAADGGQAPAVIDDGSERADSALDALPATVTDLQQTVDEPAEETVELAATPVATSVTAEPGQLALSLNFLGDCWTEITDGDGRRLFFDLGKAGRTVNVAGAAPVSVLLGNADNVRLMLNGSNYPIPDDDRRGQTARFTLAAQ